MDPRMAAKQTRVAVSLPTPKPILLIGQLQNPPGPLIHLAWFPLLYMRCLSHMALFLLPFLPRTPPYTSTCPLSPIHATPPPFHSFNLNPPSSTSVLISTATMIKTLTPFNSTDKTAEIMSRYRPIAPKPEPPSAFPSSHKINRHSTTFLRNVWPQLHSRPTRTRKRGRAAPISPHSLKRSRTTPSSNLPFPPFSSSASFIPRFDDSGVASNLVTLPLLPCGGSEESGDGSEIDFMKSFDAVCEIPEEKDLLKQLQGPVSTCSSSRGVITPHPVRPVGSSIRVGCIKEAEAGCGLSALLKKREEVEREVESEVLPAVISDSNNKVRMANSAYKEMVGQPECPWLDSMVTGDERLKKKGRRIGGEVMLDLSAAAAVPNSSNGFTCWVRIDWGNGDGKKNSVTAFCDVIKLCCVSRDYLFTWRFHTRTRGNDNDASNPICINA